MIKIGILTFHRAHNYGAVLQCYALQEVLKGYGYDVCVIDYTQPHIEKAYAMFNISLFCKLLLHPRGMFIYFKTLPYRIKRNKIFSNFRNKWLNLSNKCDQLNITQDLDVYIIGSDQVWSLGCTGNVRDNVYYGEFKKSNNSKIFGYAISSNIHSINSIDTSDLKKHISNFSTLSFRESVISDLVIDKTRAKTRVDIDPTLLVDASIWNNMVNKKWSDEKYILLYLLRKPINDPQLLNRKAMELAQQHNCKIIDLSSMKYTVEDFVSLFKYAQCVVTSSFHASVFAIIFETPLQAVMLKDGHDSRYENILNAIGAEKMLVNIDFIPEIPNIDYAPIKSRLYELQKSSKDYLQSIASKL